MPDHKTAEREAREFLAAAPDHPAANAPRCYLEARDMLAVTEGRERSLLVQMDGEREARRHREAQRDAAVGERDAFADDARRLHARLQRAVDGATEIRAERDAAGDEVARLRRSAAHWDDHTHALERERDQWREKYEDVDATPLIRERDELREVIATACEHVRWLRLRAAGHLRGDEDAEMFRCIGVWLEAYG